jgi:hypothetical protein
MPRNISSPMLASLTSNAIIPAFLASIRFKSEAVYVWTGVGNLVYGGNTYLGVGSFGKLGRITEGTDVQAYGTSISLSGIDPTLLSECLTDIQVGAPVTILFALLSSTGAVLGTPYPVFSGIVDKPVISPGISEITISLALESRMANHGRASNRRYTAADQNLYYPGDTAFNWVESLNDQALLWSA